MPNTVTVLDAPDGGKVYLVGTAHFSIQSQDDVSKVTKKDYYKCCCIANFFLCSPYPKGKKGTLIVIHLCVCLSVTANLL